MCSTVPISPIALGSDPDADESRVTAQLDDLLEGGQSLEAINTASRAKRIP